MRIQSETVNWQRGIGLTYSIDQALAMPIWCDWQALFRIHNTLRMEDRCSINGAHLDPLEFGKLNSTGATFPLGHHWTFDDILPGSVDANINLVQLPVAWRIHVAFYPRCYSQSIFYSFSNAAQSVRFSISLDSCAPTSIYSLYWVSIELCKNKVL